MPAKTPPKKAKISPRETLKEEADRLGISVNAVWKRRKKAEQLAKAANAGRELRAADGTFAPGNTAAAGHDATNAGRPSLSIRSRFSRHDEHAEDVIVSLLDATRPLRGLDHLAALICERYGLDGETVAGEIAKLIRTFIPDNRLQLAAAREVLDRAHGKATQYIDSEYTKEKVKRTMKCYGGTIRFVLTNALGIAPAEDLMSQIGKKFEERMSAGGCEEEE